MAVRSSPTTLVPPAYTPPPLGSLVKIESSWETESVTLQSLMFSRAPSTFTAPALSSAKALTRLMLRRRSSPPFFTAKMPEPPTPSMVARALSLKISTTTLPGVPSTAMRQPEQSNA